MTTSPALPAVTSAAKASVPGPQWRARLRKILLGSSLTIIAAVVCCPVARGDVGVILSESLDRGLSRWTGSGHSAVYLSRICPASPVVLRLCRPGEEGSVIANYGDFGEDKTFQWNIVPLSLFLYGVRDAKDRPLFASEKLKGMLEEQYRTSALQSECSGAACAQNPKAGWRAMVGATQLRSLYFFVAPTTVAQDLEIIAKYNSLPNENHYDNGYRNCATFTQHLVNSYFPRAAHPDYINDFSMTSPKAIARSFARYAARHLSEGYHVLHFSQVPGTVKRSRIARNGTEQLVHSPKWLLPIAYLSYHASAALLGVYEVLGHFNPQHELETRPTPRAAELQEEMKSAREEKDAAQIERLEEMIQRERDEVLGNRDDWAKYRAEFDSIIEEAIQDGVIAGREHVGKVFRILEGKGTPVLDEGGGFWLEVKERDRVRRVGLNAESLFAPGSDSELSYQLILARVDRELKSPTHSRETMTDFKADWALLQQARSRTVASNTFSPARPTR